MKNNILAKELAEYLNEGVSKYLLQYKDATALSFNDFSEIHDDYVVAEFYGGLNGCGKWTNYIRAISELITILSSNYHCWLVNLENDCLDDVFYLKLGLKHK